MGPSIQPSGARIAVITDHLAFQPKVNRSNYDYLFHVSHDLSDTNVYQNESVALKDFTALLVPSEIHLLEARKANPNVDSRVVGWTKADQSPFQIESNSSKVQEQNVLFAWTDIYNTDWRRILAAASTSPLNFILKNHVYYEEGLGFPPPPNQEREYRRYIKEAREMDKFINKLDPGNIEVVDPRSNLFSHFSRAQILITDWSSAALEFTEFGLGLETGRVHRDFVRKRVSRESSAIAKEVRFLNEKQLIDGLSWMTIKDFHELPMNASAKYDAKSFFPKLHEKPSRIAAEIIQDLIENR